MTYTENRTNTTIDWDQLHDELARPFPDEVIKYRVGAVSKDRTKAQALPYVDPRVYEDRLNELVPGAWSTSFETWGADRIICRLTIHGVTRSSTGDGAGSPSGTGGMAAESQAFRRACSKFGLGRGLYALPVRWMDYDAKSKSIRPPTPDARPRSQPPEPPASPAPDAPDTLGRTRAATMHRELARLGIARSEHLALARRALGHHVDSLAHLSEAAARKVWHHAIDGESGATEPHPPLRRTSGSVIAY